MKFVPQGTVSVGNIVYNYVTNGSLITGRRGLQNGREGQVKFAPTKRVGRIKVYPVSMGVQKVSYPRFFLIL